MKRRTMMMVTVVLSLLFIATLPVGASTLTAQKSDNAGELAQTHPSLNTNLADIVNTLPEGFHESHFEGSQNQFSCFAVGWAADPDDRTLDLNVRIFSDGVEVAQTVAGTFRQDLEDAGVCQDGTCFFSIDLWGLISPDENHVIVAQAQDAQTGEWTNLSDTPRTLNCFEENLLPEGYHDGLEGIQNQFSCIVEGWATDPNDRSIDLTIRILSDGVKVAQIVAGEFRQDLADAGVCLDGTCSFSVNLASLISPDTDHSILVQAQDAQTGEWVILFNTPKTLHCASLGGQAIVSDGFGNASNILIEALEIFKGRLYAGATNEEGTTIWHSPNTRKWTQVTSPGFDSVYGASNHIVFDLLTFKGNLYAGTGNWEATPSAGQIWRSSNGTDWHLVAADGLGNPSNAGFTTFTSFKDRIYAAALNRNDGAELWRSRTGNDNSWEQVAAQGFGGGSAYFVITTLTEFKGRLYAGVEATAGTGAQVWRSANGTDWELVSDNGFGDINNYQTGSSVVYRGKLYMTTYNDVTGAQLWRSGNGVNWEQVVGDGFGDVNNVKIESLTSYAGALYAAANNPVTGVELWRSTDGTNWTQINEDGFGHGGTFVSLWSNGTVVFQGHYLIGSSGPNGGMIWQVPR